MKTKFLFIVITYFVVETSFSQVNFNDYKYVVVSKKYDFLKQPDQYQLNSLSKFLFNKYGFEAFMEGEEYPEDLILNRCLVLKADAFSYPTLLKTRLIIQLSDCNDKVIYTSNYGESRLKDFDKAYSDALRKAFRYIEKLNHAYTPKKESAKEVKRPNIKAIETVASKTKDESNSVVEKEKPSTILYAQAISEGFQIVDSAPKVIMVLIKTPKECVFTVKGNDALVFKENGVWYYAENNKEKEVLNLKFF